MAKASTPSKYIPKGDKAVKIAALMGSERPRIHSSRNISVLKFTMAMTSKNSLVWSGHLIAIFPKIAVACGRQKFCLSKASCRKSFVRRHRLFLTSAKLRKKIIGFPIRGSDETCHR
jgi:hypothetical protein